VGGGLLGVARPPRGVQGGGGREKRRESQRLGLNPFISGGHYHGHQK
jgi:hypothetical protein